MARNSTATLPPSAAAGQLLAACQNACFGAKGLANCLKQLSDLCVVFLEDPPRLHLALYNPLHFTRSLVMDSQIVYACASEARTRVYLTVARLLLVWTSPETYRMCRLITKERWNKRRERLFVVIIGFGAPVNKLGGWIFEIGEERGELKLRRTAENSGEGEMRSTVFNKQLVESSSSI
ncbi:hypothetical protein L596_009075 [Steinernema carpocapsae]|uniref:Uncharacterized protein n=1 Tax=Steinernema carpocapsae TaxID=34508 RepID=A0A4U5PEL0_STECR|nr:hypothetical protein L596_009075 [Steinernema carpocapsae]